MGEPMMPLGRDPGPRRAAMFAELRRDLPHLGPKEIEAVAAIHAEMREGAKAMGLDMDSEAFDCSVLLLFDRMMILGTALHDHGEEDEAHSAWTVARAVCIEALWGKLKGGTDG